MTCSDLASLFPHSEPVDASAAAMGRMAWSNVPAKCAVYLLAGEGVESEPLLLATVGNLRAALQRRLADDPPEVRTKRVQYGQLCTRVYWRMVHSPFAADWWYWQSGALFPNRYKELIAWLPTWWIALEKDAKFPRLRRTQDLSDPSLDYAGPIRDRTATGKLIDTVEDLFDLCRYHSILTQTPEGKACAYKEMGKCPAPCDGSVSLGWYHGQIRAAFRFISDDASFRQAWREGEIAAMKVAAGQLGFEQAGQIKRKIERANLITAEPYEHLGRLEDFSFLSLQPGQGRTCIEPWLIHGGRVECLPQFKKKEISVGAEKLFGDLRERGDLSVRPPVDAAGVEQMAIVAHHLFRGERDAGVYVRMAEVSRGGAEFIAQLAEQFFERKAANGGGGVAEHASDHVPPAEEAVPAESP